MSSKHQPLGEHATRTNHAYLPETAGITLVEGAMVRTICSLDIPYKEPLTTKGNGDAAETCAFCRLRESNMSPAQAKKLITIGPAPAPARILSPAATGRLARAAALREHADAIA